MLVRVVRLIFFLLIVFLALPEFTLGFRSLANGMRAHGDVWSVRHDYLGDAVITLIAGFLAVGFAAWGTFRPGKANWVRFLVAAGIVLMMAVSIPNWYMSPELRANGAMMSRMRDLQTAVESWGNEHGKLPMTDQELRQAVASAHVELGDSPFQRAGKPLPYKLLAIVNAGPLPGSDAPGMFLYTVDAAGTHYWITATTLPQPVAAHVVPVRESRTSPQFVITGTVEPPSPAVAPAKPNLKTKQ
jgi:hypothetical protein